MVSQNPDPAALSAFFSALADPIRLRLLNLVEGREVCVCYFVEILRQGQPKISRHLAYLRRVGLVAARREGKWMHYRIATPADPALVEILECTLGALGRNKLLQAERARLDRACCAPGRRSVPQGAPLPALVAIPGRS